MFDFSQLCVVGVVVYFIVWVYLVTAAAEKTTFGFLWRHFGYEHLAAFGHLSCIGVFVCFVHFSYWLVVAFFLLFFSFDYKLSN